MEEATDVAEILDSTCAAYVVAETEPHAMLIRVVVSLGLQNVALLDDVRDEASRERIGEIFDWFPSRFALALRFPLCCWH